ncbi:MAG: type II toxin-antitoxin system RelE/ParE family toxin [Candidatus Adiutrix sp.]|nr:type II toxin-antitoxin system RelE/ParE family toxin [Candidatus Adiutrix sp.]
MPKAGRGKSAGYRLIICFKKNNLTFFVYAYPKMA